MGGTGVGGGTIVGLSKKLLGISDIGNLIDVASEGNLANVDLTIADITKQDIGLQSHMTAANFGKVSDVASKGDLALGLINMVFESVGMLAVFAARSKGIKDVILTGNLARLPQSKTIAETFSTLFGLNFTIPQNAEFATAIGAALR
jgi:type II pantothenate kinase